MTSINTPTYNASRTKATSVILTVLKATESCLVNSEAAFSITIEVKADISIVKTNTWSSLSFTG